MFEFISENLMLPLLNFLNQFCNNYAFSIVLLTLIVKLAFWGLNKKQFESMKKMQEIQPKVKELQEKYKETPQKMQMEIMGLYKAYNINPLGGCLPLLVQMPFFIGIFSTLRSETFQQLVTKSEFSSSFFWIQDLTVADSTYILPILIGAVTWVSQKFMTTDPKQAQMMAFMPALMVVMSFKLPAGILIYWFSSQLFSTLQQVYMSGKLDNLLKNKAKA